MIIESIMTKRVFVVSRTHPIRRVAQLLFERGLSGAPVVDETQHLVGMVSEKDIFKAMYPSYEEFYGMQNLAEFLSEQAFATHSKEIADLPVERIMKRNVIVCGAEDSIVRIGALMLAHGIHRLPVTEGNRIVGIVDRQDIFHRILEKEFHFTRSARKTKTNPAPFSSSTKVHEIVNPKTR